MLFGALTIILFRKAAGGSQGVVSGGAVFVHRQRLRGSAAHDGVSHTKKTAGRYRSAFLFPYVSLM